jgi:hypothetical protein
MSVSQTGVAAHDKAVNTAEYMRQVAVAASTTRAAATAAEITFYRAGIAGAKANNVACISVYQYALKSLGLNS